MGGKARWHGRDRDVTYQNNAWSNCRMPRSVYAQGWEVKRDGRDAKERICQRTRTALATKAKCNCRMAGSA